jgi:two-component system, cell cycle response regulator DivK
MVSDILIVDDEESVRQLLRLMLRTLNVTVREAADGHEALNKIKESQPSLVILDVMMPQIDGLTVLKQLRADPKTKSLPVLLFTAFRVTNEQAAELDVPHSMIMNKGSLSVKELRGTVAQVLGYSPQ